MKKILLIILVVVILASMSLVVACSNVNQLNMLSMGWSDYEKFTYDVYKQGDSENDRTLIGEMVYTFERTNSKEINGKTFNQNKGATCSYELTIFEGEYAGTTLNSVVFFNSTFNPNASYKVLNSSNPDLSYSTFADYTTSSKNGTYTYTKAGQDHTSTFKKTSAYDNESLYTLIRASVFDYKSYGLSMNVPDNETYALKSVTASISAKDTRVESNYMDKSFECTTVVARIAASKGQGTAHVLDYTNSAVRVGNQDVVKVLVRIIEGDYVYILKDISLAK